MTEEPDIEFEWPDVIVQTSAFMHVLMSPSCAGATFTSSGLVRCVACDWMLGARSDNDAIARARFALFTLAHLGSAMPQQRCEVIDEYGVQCELGEQHPPPHRAAMDGAIHLWSTITVTLPKGYA